MKSSKKDTDIKKKDFVYSQPNQVFTLHP